MNVIEQSRKPGRPKRYPARRPVLSIRLTPEVAANVRQRAKEAGRSISEEIEYRLVSQHEIHKALASAMPVPNVPQASPAGRPPRHSNELLTKNRTFRIRPSLDEALVRAAAEAGRSVSAEIEYRLDHTHDFNGKIEELAETIAARVVARINAERAPSSDTGEL